MMEFRISDSWILKLVFSGHGSFLKGHGHWTWTLDLDFGFTGHRFRDLEFWILDFGFRIFNWIWILSIHR